MRTLHSDIVGGEYELSISLPHSYSTADTTFPVMFLLDPYNVFSIVKNLTDVFTADYTIIPEVIIVGIGYGGNGKVASSNWVLGRLRDYTPVRNIKTEEYFEKRLEEAGLSNVEVKTGGAHSDLEAEVFMSAGGSEIPLARNMEKMIEMLLLRNYKSLKLESAIFDNETHVTSYPAALSRGRC